MAAGWFNEDVQSESDEEDGDWEACREAGGEDVSEDGDKEAREDGEDGEDGEDEDEDEDEDEEWAERVGRSGGGGSGSSGRAGPFDDPLDVSRGSSISTAVAADIGSASKFTAPVLERRSLPPSAVHTLGSGSPHSGGAAPSHFYLGSTFHRPGVRVPSRDGGGGSGSGGRSGASLEQRLAQTLSMESGSLPGFQRKVADRVALELMDEIFARPPLLKPNKQVDLPSPLHPPTTPPPIPSVYG